MTPGEPDGAGEPVVSSAIQVGDEALRPPGQGAESDSVSFSFAAVEAGLFGVARIGVSDGRSPDGAPIRSASGLALLFGGSDVAAVAVQGGVATGASDWEGLEAAGITTSVDKPLARWRVSFDGGAEGSFDLGFESLGSPAAVAEGGRLHLAGGMLGYEHVCRVLGSVTVAGTTTEIACLGQRGRGWGAPDWDGMAMTRSLGAWFGDGLALTFSAIRPRGADDHAAEAAQAIVLAGEPLEASTMGEARLSTVYDGDGRQRRAGLELWASEESEYPRRCSGEVVCGTSLDLGRLRLESAFFRWRMEGREGAGRYDVVRRA